LEVVVFVVDEVEEEAVVEVVVVEPEPTLRTAWNSFQATENKGKRFQCWLSFSRIDLVVFLRSF